MVAAVVPAAVATVVPICRGRAPVAIRPGGGGIVAMIIAMIRLGAIVAPALAGAVIVRTARCALGLVAVAAGLVGEAPRFFLALRRHRSRAPAPVEGALRTAAGISEGLLALLDEEGRGLAVPEPGDPAAIA